MSSISIADRILPPLTAAPGHAEEDVMRIVAVSLAALLALAGVAPAPAQNLPKVTVGMSGWTGFAPLSLAEKTGIFKRHGVDVTIKFIPQKDRHLAIASGHVQCAATTVETWIVWNANGVATKQVVQLDKSYGADGMVVRPSIARIADLKGDGGCLGAGDRAVLHAGVDAEEERARREGRQGRQ